MSKKVSGLLNLLQLSKRRLFFFVVLGIASGVSNLLIIATINNLMNAKLLKSGSASVDIKLLLMFTGSIAIWFISRKVLAVMLIGLTQKTLWGYRENIISNVFRSNLTFVRNNKERVYTALTEDASDISAASANMIDFIISTVSVICIFGYMLWLSVPFFLVTLLMVLSGIGVYALSERKNKQRFDRTKSLMDKYHSLLNASLTGFKENKMDLKKQKSIQQDIEAIADQAVENNTKAFVSFLDNQMIGQLGFYLLIGTLIVLHGAIIDVPASLIVTYLFALMYMIGPIEVIMSLMPGITKARSALERIEGIILDQNKGVKEAQEEELLAPEKFENLQLVDVTYSYASNLGNSFALGPVNFELNSGEIIFISGGNGSGKTTLINVLLNLLKPDSGTISMNGNALLYSEAPYAYRSVFTVVFNDFFLFEKMYGLDKLDVEAANYWINRFELQHKVQLLDNKFSSQSLSTGERKRLALIVSILEKKQIVVLDEWAADQDPYFREKFYKELLPEFKRMGLTVLAITHDDHYFDCCDKLFRVSEGQLIQLEVYNVV